MSVCRQTDEMSAEGYEETENDWAFYTVALFTAEFLCDLFSSR